MDPINDPALYRKLSEPFADAATADAAYAAFFTDVRAARERHRLPDVVLIVAYNVTTPDGERRLMRMGSNGNSGDVYTMLRDVTLRELKDRQAELSNVVQAMHDAKPKN